MKILGIDPGLQVCGYACLQVTDGDEKLVEAGIFRTSAEAAIEFRLKQIGEDIEAVLRRFEPEYVAVEELYSHYAHPATSILMGHARGVILERCARFGVEIKSFSATRIKKSTTGNGRASKEQIQRAVQFSLSLPELPEPNDVADAIAVAICCGNSLSMSRMLADRKS